MTLADLKEMERAWRHGGAYPFSRDVCQRAIGVLEQAERRGFLWKMAAKDGGCVLTLTSMDKVITMQIRPPCVTFEVDGKVLFDPYIAELYPPKMLEAACQG